MIEGKTSAALIVFFLASFVAETSFAAFDHNKYLMGQIDRPQAITKKCLSCHKPTALGLVNSSHWTWSGLQDISGRGTMEFGKKNAIDNFWIGLSSNWLGCTSCHPGYGWKDNSFDFKKYLNLDCLVCHDSTDTYRKAPEGAGMPEGFSEDGPGKDAPDLLNIARKRALPTRKICGSCHFYCGGGDNVKHGDLDSSLVQPEKKTDVHMAADGANFTCQSCHKTKRHDIKGNALSVSPAGTNRIDCTDCHGWTPHKSSYRLNDHTLTVACQTCHIPFFAKEVPTLVSWDWSAAGQDKKAEKDPNGMPTFDKKRGALQWAKNVPPSYAWFNGKADVVLVDDAIDPARPVRLNMPKGAKTEKVARIFPFKIHRSKQIYDKKTKTLIVPKLVGPDGFFQSFDWNKAAKAGMQELSRPYSGEYGFVETEMRLRINHMVVPAKEALQCENCHEKNTRMDWQALGFETVGPYPKGRKGLFASPSP